MERHRTNHAKQGYFLSRNVHGERRAVTLRRQDRDLGQGEIAAPSRQRRAVTLRRQDRDLGWGKNRHAKRQRLLAVYDECTLYHPAGQTVVDTYSVSSALAKFAGN
jgi:hypothetical protein